MPLFTPANLGTMETFFIFFLESSPTLLSLVRIFSSRVTTFSWGQIEQSDFLEKAEDNRNIFSC